MEAQDPFSKLVTAFANTENPTVKRTLIGIFPKAKPKPIR